MIAISYRREDTLPVAGRLYDRLEQRFGKQNVFMDFDSIRPGFDFRDQIKDTIGRSKVVIAIIGPHWLGKKSDGTRRIDDPADFVRLEVACALQREIPVIPVLVNNTPMPKSEELPSDIQALAFRHALPLDSGLDFRQHADRLMNSISETADSPIVSLTGSGRRPKLLSRAAATAFLIVIGVLLVATYVWKNLPTKSEQPTNTSPISAQPVATDSAEAKTNYDRSSASQSTTFGTTTAPIPETERIPPRPKTYFADYAGVVSSDAASRFNEQLAQFERDTSNQVVVAIYLEMDSTAPIDGYTRRIANAWGVGQRGKNNGVTLFVFIEKRQMFMQVGEGLANVLPNRKAFDITERRIKPHFVSNDYEGGIRDGINAILDATRGAPSR